VFGEHGRRELDAARVKDSAFYFGAEATKRRALRLAEAERNRAFRDVAGLRYEGQDVRMSGLQSTIAQLLLGVPPEM
jgi:hypothetical protein